MNKKNHAPIGVYIHVPFCQSICPYCDFYSGIADKKNHDEYLKSLILSIKNQPYQNLHVDSVFFGGGTPTILDPTALGNILNELSAKLKLSPTAEITFESNPETVDEAYLKNMRKNGFNRVSFGVQSMNNRELSALGRIHSPEKSMQAITWAKSAGFENISADLMLGIPYQTPESIMLSADCLMSLDIEHISAYMLGVSPDTAYYESPVLDHCLCDDELSAAYTTLVKLFSDNGFEQYEISNFAKHDKKSRHNLKYWQLGDYLGFGPSAHSFINGQRFCFSSDLSHFIKTNGSFDEVIDKQTGGDAKEYIMLALRLSEGLNIKKLQSLFPDFSPHFLIKTAEKFEGDGLLEITDHTIKLTTKGFLVSNSIIAEFI